jgi:hypothetical protein
MFIGRTQASTISKTIGIITRAMKNTGYWDTDLLFFFVLCFFSPVVLYFLAGFIIKASEFWQSLSPEDPEPVYIPVIETVYREKPTKKKSKKSKKGKSKVKGVKKKNNTILDEAIACLIGIGHNKKSAKVLVEQIYNPKKHQKAEDIVAQAIQMCI